jgi:hypothetical protein
MNPGGGIISNHTATKNIPFIQGSRIGAVTQSNWLATSCAKKTCVQNKDYPLGMLQYIMN